MNLIDTAEIYGFGKSESIIGRAIRDIRGQAFIATKVFPILPGRSKRAPRPQGIAHLLEPRACSGKPVQRPAAPRVRVALEESKSFELPKTLGEKRPGEPGGAIENLAERAASQH